MAKRASRTLPDVGRVVMPAGARSTWPLWVPAIMRKTRSVTRLHCARFPGLLQCQAMGHREKTVEPLVARMLQGRAECIALRQGSRLWTYAQLDEQVRRVASALIQLPLAPGERVGVFMRDTLEAAAALLGVMHAGCIAMPISELVTSADLRTLLFHSEASCVFVESSLEPVLDSIRADLPGLRFVVCVGAGSPGTLDMGELLRSADPTCEGRPQANDAPCVLLYSSSPHPDAPRGVPHTERTLCAAYDSYAKGYLQLTAHDKVLSITRLSTAFGLGSGLLFPLRAGAEAVLLPEQPHSDVVFSTVAREQPTLVFATPTLLSQLVNDGAGHEGALRGPRRVVAGAEAMSQRLATRVKEVLGTDVSAGFGVTEIFGFALASRAGAPPVDGVPGLPGSPLPDIQLRIMTDEGAPAGDLEIGTLQIACPALATAYWKGTSPEAFVDGWHVTSDRFLRDAQGNYHHCGRTNDSFKVSGKWVSPLEVEQSLRSHTAVWDCAVTGVEDDDGVTRTMAFVVPNIGFVPSRDLEDELRAYVKHRLSPYKYPRWIEFVDAVPRGPTGKLLRFRLRPKRRSI